MAKETETTRELIVRLTKSLGAYGGKAVITDRSPSDDEIASGTLETFDVQLDTALAEHHISVAIRRTPARSVMFATSVRRGNGGRDTWDGPATEQGWGRMMTAMMAFEAMLKDPEATSYPANANALAERPHRPE